MSQKRGNGAAALRAPDEDDDETQAALNTLLNAHKRAPKPVQDAFMRIISGRESFEDDDHDPTAALLPQDSNAKRSPEVGCNIFSRLLFLFLNPLMRLGASKPLEDEDLWDLAPWNETSAVHERYERQLQATAVPDKYPHGSVGSALVRAFGTRWLLAGLLKLTYDVVNLSSPYVLRQLLHTLKTQEVGEVSSHGTKVALGWSFGLFACGVVTPLLINQYFVRVFNTSLHVKAALIQALYAKSLKISLRAKAGIASTGSVVNLQSNDGSKLWNLPQYGHVVWSAPLQVIIIIVSLHTIVGWQSALAGLATTLMLVPLNAYVSKIVLGLRKELIAKTEARVKVMTEIVNGIKAIKLYAWESPYGRRLGDARRAEQRAIRNVQLMASINQILFLGGPILVAMAAFFTYAHLGNDLTADIAFPALAYFDLLRFPIIMLPIQVMNFINAKVALGRLQKFMSAGETEKKAPEPAAASVFEDPEAAAIEVSDAAFKWNPEDADEGPTLSNINLSIPPGALVIVTGCVACGKSSLLAGLLHEISCLAGKVHVRGRIAYTAQDPWIQNSSVKGNILMGSEFDEDWYERVLEACALKPDLQMLPAGDATEIGEKGVNLSGGQKHRIALARACYAAADIYLLDDPLSAVDAHVGQHIVSQCVTNLLAHRTRVLVTHQLQYLHLADVVVRMANGSITHVGPYAELVAKGVEFAELRMMEQDTEDAEDGAADAQAPAAAADGPAAPAGELVKNGAAVGGTSAKAGKAAAGVSGGKATGQLTQKEDRSTGAVSRKVYMAYLGSWGPCFIVPFLFLVVALIERTCSISQNYWLSYWSEATVTFRQAHPKDKFNTDFYLSVYFAIGFTSLTLQSMRAITLVLASLSASKSLHDRLATKLMRLPMSFFDTQPSGRLLNRFTKDMEACDTTLGPVINSFTGCFSSVALNIVVIICVSKGAVVAALVPLYFLYRHIQNYFLSTSCELKRLDSIAMSPIFSSFSETLNGLTTVRAFGKQALFLRRNQQLMNASSRAWWPIQLANRWLSIRLELMGQLIVLGTAVTVTLFVRQAGLAGFALTSAMALVGIMNWATRMSTEVEMGMNSVERLLEYLAHDEEKPAVLPHLRPPLQWPSHGRLTVSNLVVRYRPELPAVLKDLTFVVEPSEKVGICGRTGCGKSTLMLALYRIVEPSRGSSIRIDGVEVTNIGLEDLRSKLSLVPQDPVVFSGTIRSNLDPFGNFRDLECMEALEQSGLAATIKNMASGLDSPVEEGGTNFSTGERQLLCMARALLKRSKILLMDEATSNVDNQTDALIQRTIRTAFKNCTVLTIAHRLHTIIDSDKILMLSHGELLEYDVPQRLLQQPNSAFRAMVMDSTTTGVSGIQASSSAQDLVRAAIADS